MKGIIMSANTSPQTAVNKGPDCFTIYMPTLFDDTKKTNSLLVLLAEPGLELRKHIHKGGNSGFSQIYVPSELMTSSQIVATLVAWYKSIGYQVFPDVDDALFQKNTSANVFMEEPHFTIRVYPYVTHKMDFFGHMATAIGHADAEKKVICCARDSTILHFDTLEELVTGKQHVELAIGGAKVIDLIVEEINRRTVEQVV